MFIYYGEHVTPFVRHQMVHRLPHMQMLLLRPRAPCLPCLVRAPYELLNRRCYDSGTCYDLILATDKGDSITMLMTFIYEHSTIRYVLEHSFPHSCVHLGGHVARVVQRAWRRFRERRRLALCMAWRNSESPLGRILRTLCVEDLGRMVA
jgi:hypothetical protein